MPKMKFRTDISFLRAFSVIIVMLFHLEVLGFAGGFLGVDVFNVISGFLMTMIILRGFEDDTYSLKGFYARRIKRLVPALSVVLVFVLLISAVFFLQADLRLNAKYSFLADLFVSNIYFWKYQSYFTSTNNILLHSWSLGVEWQFYVFYPLILMAIRGLYFKNKRLFWLILSIVTSISIFIMLWIGSSNTNFIFYMLPSRYWELSMGGLAYGLGQRWKPSARLKYVLVLVGIGVLVGCDLWISSSDLWPSAFSFLPVFAVFIILCCDLSLPVFNYRPIRFMGDISYSLYLWHWPIYIYFKYFGFLGGYYTVVIVLLSVMAAYISYKYIERNRSIATVKFGIVSTMAIGLISIIIFLKPNVVKPLSIYRSGKFEIGNFRAEYLNSGRKDKQFNPCGCFVTDGQTFRDYNKKRCLSFSSTKKNILLLGDSHAAEFSEAMRSLKEYNILEASVGYTLPVPDSKGKPGLVELNKYIFDDFIPQNKNRINLVVISAHWLMRHAATINYSEQQTIEKVKELIYLLNKNNIKYLFIGQTETYELDYPKILMLRYFGRNEKDYLKEEAKNMNDSLKRIIPFDNYVDIYESPLINHYDKLNKTPYMFDNNHMTFYGANQVISKIIEPRIRDLIN